MRLFSPNRVPLLISGLTVQLWSSSHPLSSGSSTESILRVKNTNVKHSAKKMTNPLRLPHPCWMVTLTRTGSTFLCDLLNSTLLFGEHGTAGPELGVVDRWTEFYCKRFFREEYLESLPAINKIHWFQFLEHFPSGFHPEFKNLRYIWLRRDDLCEVAVSQYFVNIGKPLMKDLYQWNIHEKEDYQRMVEMEVEFDPEELLRLYKMTLPRRSRPWERFLYGRNYIEIEYQELLSDPVGTANRCLDFIGLEGDVNPNWEHLPMRLEHPRKKEFVERLRALVNEKEPGL